MWQHFRIYMYNGPLFFFFFGIAILKKNIFIFGAWFQVRLPFSLSSARYGEILQECRPLASKARFAISESMIQ